MKRHITITTALLTILLASCNGGEKPYQEDETDLAEILRSSLEVYLSDAPDAVAGLASISEVGSGKNPVGAMLARSEEDSTYTDLSFTYYYDAVPVIPGGIMQTATLMYYIDEGRISLDRLIPTNHGRLPKVTGLKDDYYLYDYERMTGRDSISVDEGFLLSSRYVTERYVLDDIRKGYDSAWHGYISRFMDYFGPSSAYFLPRNEYRMETLEKEALLIADGAGIILSQGQILNLYGSIANGGVRPAYRYHGKKAVCSEETASEITGLLTRNVIAGTGRRLKDNIIPVAGKYGSGILDMGFLPCYGYVREKGRLWLTSFVGFFPFDEPKYTLCVTVYFNDYPDYSLCTDAFGDMVDEINGNGLL